MREHGFSLLELLLALSLLAILMTLAVPERSTPRPEALDLAATEIVQALRYARSQSIRTSEPHGVYISSTDDRIRLYLRDTEAVSRTVNYTVRHPISKQAYDFDLNDNVLTQDVAVIKAIFQFEGVGSSQSELEFDSNGTPHLYTGGEVRLLTNVALQVSNGADTTTIDVHRITGRVTVQ
jgi:prepilin-type N-terminal cleavage/methylation domain-containing protein